MTPLYIISSSCISPQASFASDDMFAHVNHSNNNMLTCIEPDFSKYINPVQIRRMSRALKIGYSAAMECLHKQAVITPEAIIIGTGKGCLSDTEHFLHSIKEYNETALNATHFIHSTYNQLNGMIALNQKISSYNITYVHRAYSFEHTLIDTALLFSEDEITCALVGSFDEMTTEHFRVKKHWGYWKNEFIDSRDLLKSNTVGTISGEGAAFYLLQKNKPTTPCVSIQDIRTLFKATFDDIQSALTHLLASNHISINDIDVVLSGENGDANYAIAYQQFHALFANAQITYFKHLCGEYDTSVSFACYVASEILLTQKVPDTLLYPETKRQKAEKSIRYVLIYNNYFQLNQSLILMKLHRSNTF